MKNYTYIFICLFCCSMLFACDTYEEYEMTNSAELQDKSSTAEFRRSLSEALQIAQDAASILEKNETNIGKGSKRVSSVLPKRRVNSSPIIVSSNIFQQRRASNSQEDTLIYVFNFNDNQGFAVISADSRTEGLLAVTETGHYDQDEVNQNEGFKMFMELAEKYVTTPSKPARIKPIDDGFILVKDSTYQSESYIGPYINVQWGQSYPEGIYCNNGLCGCANTAMAQIMSYYEYPTGINLTYQGADVTYQELNWDEIKQHISTATCTASSETHNVIGRLCKQLVTLNGSNDYGSDGTTTSPTNINVTYTNLGYQTSGWQNYNDARNLIYSFLLNQGVIQVRGAQNGLSIGHEWVMDGVYVLFYEHFSWTKPANSFGGWTLDSHTTETHAYYHLNWGWNGNCNGYFYEGVFDTTSGINYDTGVHTANYNFNTEIQMLFVTL